MNEFVEECRREWKRLGVPDLVASEMAADLAADLEEAEAEGATAEEVLGSGAFDPRSFAAAWAAERGLIRRPPRRLLRRSRLPAAIGAVFALIAIVGAVLVIPDSSGPRFPDLPPPPGFVATPDGVFVVAAPGPMSDPSVMVDLPPPPGFVATPDGVFVVAAPGPMPDPSVMVIAGDLNESGDDTHTIGSVLLIVGLAGTLPWMLFWLWAPARGASPL